MYSKTESEVSLADKMKQTCDTAQPEDSQVTPPALNKTNH